MFQLIANYIVDDTDDDYSRASILVEQDGAAAALLGLTASHDLKGTPLSGASQNLQGFSSFLQIPDNRGTVRKFGEAFQAVTRALAAHSGTCQNDVDAAIETFAGHQVVEKAFVLDAIEDRCFPVIQAFLQAVNQLLLCTDRPLQESELQEIVHVTLVEIAALAKSPECRLSEFIATLTATLQQSEVLRSVARAGLPLEMSDVRKYLCLQGAHTTTRVL